MATLVKTPSSPKPIDRRMRMNAKKRCKLRRTVRCREERQRLETQWREERKKGGGVVLSVPKVLLHRHTRQYSLDNRMLYRVWLFRAKSHR
ncbi:hypothetical protein [Candidatus Williamhamiltonella defendens]|uniref:hypothetical protein n=1 Tax=Candidatus Williamhamiltonella defendens TaxID=138072 RepID=UPI0015817F3B|nr:hypothetical protein [Candidatus Hamiltonella defensa]